MDNPNNGASKNSNNGFPGHINGKNGYFINHLPQESRQQDEENFTIEWLLNLIWYYKWGLLVIIALCTLAAAFLARRIQPVYQGSGTLIIQNSKNQYSYAGSDISNLLTNSYGLGVGSSFANQLAIIRSRKIAEETAKKLLKNPTMSNGKKYPILYKKYPDDTTTVRKSALIGRIRSKLDVSRANKKADLARVTFKSYSPVEAAAMVNLIIDTYTDVSTQKNRQAAHSAGQFLRKQRKKISHELRKAEEKLKNFQQKTGLVAAETQTTSSFQELSQLQQQKEQQSIKLSSINMAIQNYQKQLKKIRPAFSKNFAENVAPMLSELKNKLSQLEAKRFLLLSKNPSLKNNPSQSPQLVTYNRQIKALKSNIRRRANRILTSGDSSYSGFASEQEGTSKLIQLRQNLVQARVQKAQARAQISVIDSLLTGEKKKLHQVPQKTLTLERLKRNVNIKQSLYKTISQQYAQTSLWAQTQFGLGTPLNYATKPHVPIKPNFYSYILRGLILGLFLGFGYVYLRESTNKKIDTPGKLMDLAYPLLSVIPDFAKSELYGEHRKNGTGQGDIHPDWITLYDNNSAAAEAFRKLQNNILYSRPDEPLQSVMITSGKQGEGKTSVATNLATTLTEGEKKVLLIESDLRRPKLHTIARVRKSPGLLDAVFNENSIDECVLPTKKSNLFILPVGKKLPTPSTVLRSEKFKDVISLLKSQYDYILFDTPPLGTVGDAAPIARLADGVIVVSKFKKTDIGGVKGLLDELEHLHAPILGTVLTAFDSKKSLDRYYHQTNYHYSYDSYESYIKES